MFRLLNKSAIWHLCQCDNHWLWNSSKWPFTGALLQSASRCNTRVPWADGQSRVRGRLVGQSVGGIKFLTLFRCAGSLGRRAFQAVGSAKCVISLTHMPISTKYTCGLSTSEIIPVFPPLAINKYEYIESKQVQYINK